MTPTTPAEMADWLEELSLDYLAMASRVSNIGKPESDNNFGRTAVKLAEIATWIRNQPTDAQKIEALKLASIAGFTLSGQFPPEALRLLGLPTE